MFGCASDEQFKDELEEGQLKDELEVKIPLEQVGEEFYADIGDEDDVL